MLRILLAVNLAIAVKLFDMISQLVVRWLNYKAFVVLDDGKTSVERVGLILT